MAGEQPANDREDGAVDRPAGPQPAADSGPRADLDWRDWVDGRPRRLKRGRDYTGDPKAVVKQAEAVALELGKVAVDSRDSQGKYEYLWIQFVDGAVEPGQPCPVCGGTALDKVQKHFLRCARCGSTLHAADDWGVEAGEFSVPSPPEDEADGPVDAELEVEPGPRAEDYAEILTTRLESVDGREIDSPLVNEEFFLVTGFRFLRPVDSSHPRIRLAMAGAGPVLRILPPYPLVPSGLETVDVRVLIPRDLLMPRVYKVEIVLFVLPDRNAGEYLKLMSRESLEFSVGKAGPRDIAEAEAGLGSPFRWDLVRRSRDAAEPR